MDTRVPENDSKHTKPYVVPWLLSGLLILPWLVIQHNMSINSNVAWLSICAERLLSGGNMLHDCYDTNPPLSILIYMPFFMLAKSLAIEIYSAMFVSICALIALCTLATNSVTQKFNQLSACSRHGLILAYICSITIIPTVYFAERDHFIAIMVLPFILVQLALTYKINIPKAAQYFILTLGSIAFLLKPHYGLIPLAMVIHRIILQRRTWIIKDLDMQFLITATTLYTLLIFVTFQDFVNIILPDVWLHYLPLVDSANTYQKAVSLSLLIIILVPSLFYLNKSVREVAVPIFISSALCLLVFIVQMKGFTYHRLPLFGVLLPLITLLSFTLIQEKTNFLDKRKHQNLFLLGATIIIFIASYSFSPLRPAYPTHTAYKANPIEQYIDTNCSQEKCSFYITYENMDIVSQIAFYSKHTYATRFPTYWFFQGLNDSNKDRYAQYVAEDLKRFNPEFIFVLKGSDGLGTLAKNQTFVGLFEHSILYKNALSNYHKVDTLQAVRAYFYKGTPYDFLYNITWDIYQKSNK